MCHRVRCGHSRKSHVVRETRRTLVLPASLLHVCSSTSSLRQIKCRLSTRSTAVPSSDVSKIRLCSGEGLGRKPACRGVPRAERRPCSHPFSLVPCVAFLAALCPVATWSRAGGAYVWAVSRLPRPCSPCPFKRSFSIPALFWGFVQLHSLRFVL